MFSPKKKGWFSWFRGGGAKKQVYSAGEKEEYIDPKTGEKKVRTKVDLNQYNQVQSEFNEELGKWVFFDGNGNPLPDEDSDDDADEVLPKMRRRPRPKNESASNPLSSMSRVPEEVKENMSGNNSRDATSESMEEKGIEHLQREILKLKEENMSLRQRLQSSSSAHSNLNTDNVSKKVMDQLNQNQRILRYLHQWADHLPAVMNRNSLEMLSEFDLKPRPVSSGSSGLFGVSMLHLMVIMILTVLLVFWETTMAGNNMDDDGMNLIDATIEFAYSLYIMSMGYVPDEMSQQTEVAMGYGQMMMNQTATFTLNLVSKIT